MNGTKYLRMLMIAGFLSLACTTKVSEWVLLNSEPVQYTLIYVHGKSLSETSRQQNNELVRNLKSANITFRSAAREGVERPFYELYYKNRLFSRYDDYRELEKLSASPLRDKIAGELMSGKLCVMLFLRSGNREKDDASLQVVKKTLASSPFGRIVTVMELSRNSADEKHFVSNLLNVESDLKNINEPMLFGIFGRFSALEPLLARGISQENINLMIDFLTADCSCLIKDDLPGVNILYKGSWDNPAPAMVNRILEANPSLLHR